MTKKRIVFTIREGETVNKLFKRIPQSSPSALLHVPDKDAFAEKHLYPLEKTNKRTEKALYKSQFYNTLGSLKRDIYRTYTLDVDDEDQLNAHLREFQSQSSIVESYFEDAVAKFSQVPKDRFFPLQRKVFQELEILQSWDIATSLGGDVTVAVIDSGVNVHHPDLEQNLWINPRNGHIGFSYDRHPMEDLHSTPIGHGTPVSGIISAIANSIGVVGIAPRSKIQAHKLELINDGVFLTQISAAIQNAEMSGARVVNCSFEVDQGNESAFRNCARIINDASKKMAVVIAAGNLGINVENNPLLNKLTDAIVVGGLNPDDFRNPISSFGRDVMYAYFNVPATSRSGRYDDFTGTSAATPQIAAVCALIMGYNFNIPAFEIRKILTRSCRRGPLYPEEGRGKINARLAMEEVANRFGPSLRGV